MKQQERKQRQQNAGVETTRKEPAAQNMRGWRLGWRIRRQECVLGNGH